MTPNKETIWITIPDEGNSPSDKPVKAPENESADTVKNKAFWGAGLVALIVFASLLLVPKEMSHFMQAQLFDGSFQVVPDFEEQDQGTLFGEGDDEDATENGAESNALGDTGDENVVEAEAEAVSIQIEPLAETATEEAGAEEGVAESGTTTSEETGVSGSVEDEAAGTEAGTEAVDEGVVAEPVTEAEPVELDTEVTGTGENADLYESLSKQLDEYKDKEARNEQLIQELMQMLEDQAAGLKPVAGSALAQASDAGAEAAVQIGTGGTSAVTTVGVGTSVAAGVGTGTYRYNTHTVTVSPYDVLAQNRGAQQASYQANVSYSQVQPYSQENYNTVLSGVQGQPDTGPAEAMLFALFLASMGILAWGTLRAIKA